MGAFCTRSCPFSSPSSSFTSKSLQSWTQSVSRDASESGWKRSNRRGRKPPVRPREPRAAAVSDFPGTAERVPTERKNGCCAKVQENRKFDQSPAQRVRSKKEMRQTWETPKRAKSDDFGRCGKKAGESQGVVRAPWQTHLPAVRAVWGFVRMFQKQRKSAPRRCSTKKARRFKENGGVPTKNTG